MELVRAGNRRILFIMAAPPEYGPALRARFTPLMTGVGPVEAGLAAGAALARLEARGETPDLAVCLGSAGSRTLEQTGVYQVASVSYRDIDASPLGIPAGLTPYLDLPRELPLQVLLPDLPAVRLSTGGAVISGTAYDAIDADMVDMETFAVARACMAHGVPLAGLRGVSDGAEDLSKEDLGRLHRWIDLCGNRERLRLQLSFRARALDWSASWSCWSPCGNNGGFD